MRRRHIQDSVRRALTDTPVVLLNGARQTGKTTLAQALAARQKLPHARGYALEFGALIGESRRQQKLN